VALAREYEGVEIPEARLAQLTPGQTTKGDVLALFGAPYETRRTSYGDLAERAAARFVGDALTLKIDPALYDEVLVYQYRRVNRFAVVGGFFNYFSSDEKVDRLVLFFGPDGKLITFGFTSGTREL
jgi:hypothetical protein